MTDKQITHYGLDISGCEYLGMFEKCKLKCGSCYLANCSDNPNCYYKQLKRKEQECEGLKKELQAQRDFTAHEQKLIYCVAYDESCKTGNDCKQKKCIFKDNIKLKQTLIEIKKIAEILAPMTDEYENCYDRDRCFECDFTEDCSYFNTKRIIQICDEAINE